MWAKLLFLLASLAGGVSAFSTTELLEACSSDPACFEAYGEPRAPTDMPAFAYMTRLIDEPAEVLAVLESGNFTNGASDRLLLRRAIALSCLYRETLLRGLMCDAGKSPVYNSRTLRLECRCRSDRPCAPVQTDTSMLVLIVVLVTIILGVLLVLGCVRFRLEVLLLSASRAMSPDNVLFYLSKILAS